MESKAAKGTKPLGCGAEELPLANPQGGTALREQSVVQVVASLLLAQTNDAIRHDREPIYYFRRR